MDHIAVKCQDQSQLLEKTVQYLEASKEAYYKAERDMRDREARFEREKEAFDDETHGFEVRFCPYLTLTLWHSMSVSGFPPKFCVEYEDRLMLIFHPRSRQSRLVKSGL